MKGESAEVKKLFLLLNEKITDISSEIEQYTTKSEIIYKTSLNFAYLAIQNKKDCIRCLLKTENDKIKDPKKLTTKIPKHFHHGNITRKFSISPQKIKAKKYTIDDVIEIIEQSYNTTQ